jgi:hypothetical protein
MTKSIYIIIGLLLSILPLMLKLIPVIKVPTNIKSFLNILEKYIVILAAISIAAFFWALKNNLFFAASCLVIAIFLSYKERKVECKVLIVSLLFLLASSKLLWWYNESDGVYEWKKTIVFFILSILSFQGLRASFKKIKPRYFYSSLLGCVLVLAFFSFNTGGFTEDALQVTVHHWGAYIGPSQAMDAGARIFYDIPTQYGFGPNLLITSVHQYQGNFWMEMYWLNGITIFLYSMLLLLSVVLVRKGQNFLQTAVCILACVIAIFFWSGYAPTVTFLPMCPSVTGFRFAPVALLTLSSRQ